MTWMRKREKRSLKNIGGTEPGRMANVLDWKGNLTGTYKKNRKMQTQNGGMSAWK